ncbi:hypothetical protein SUGI_0374450 [Cryptomeria japonica]|nr:hypothetical protein SUGI_0374450 [Cryptomeria japonica]
MEGGDNGWRDHTRRMELPSMGGFGRGFHYERQLNPRKLGYVRHFRRQKCGVQIIDEKPATIWGVCSVLNGRERASSEVVAGAAKTEYSEDAVTQKTWSSKRACRLKGTAGENHMAACIAWIRVTQLLIRGALGTGIGNFQECLWSSITQQLKGNYSDLG